MKTIGLLGGTSWEGTASYLQTLNAVVRERLGTLHSARCLLYGVDFYGLEKCMVHGNWDRCAEMIVDGAKRLEKGGADFIVPCTNTTKRIADRMEAAVSIPVAHIADATADELERRGIRRVGMIGTRFTLEQNFNISRLAAREIETVIPDIQARQEINRIIFQELCFGIGKDASRDFILGVVARLARQGAEGVVLGCSEMGLLIDCEDACVPLVDAVNLHATRAAELSLGLVDTEVVQ